MKRLHFYLLFLLLVPFNINAETRLPVVSIIIDDLGQDLQAAQQVIDLPGSVVSAVLPNTKHAQQVAFLTHYSGKEVILHQPMQSVAGNRLGGGAIVLDMTRQQVWKTLESNLNKIPFAVGMNHHMGSLISQHPGHMSWIMEYLKQRSDLFYIDSRTTKETVAQQLASEVGVRNTRRNVFLDHDVTEQAISYQLHRMIRLARRDGSAVAIGHPFPETISVLRREIPHFAEYGVRLVPVSEVIALRNGEKSRVVEVAGKAK
ncbi:MAG: divergent polysaccharide deacetylase family protein [Gammaproteobacteria bacterium]|nr:MAG: divergent polysaccharide deacetylase family protein [Gammaproteobacteria bacterium]